MNKEELIYKVADELDKRFDYYEDALIGLAEIEGVDLEDIKERSHMQLAKTLVEEGIITSKHFEC